MDDTFTFTREKFQALLVRIFTDGCKGQHDFYQRVIDYPDSMLKILQTFLKLPKGSNSQIVIKSCDLLAILKDAFQEGKTSYPETRESVVQRLMASLPKPLTSGSISMERYEKEFQRMLFDKWARLEYITAMSSTTTNNDNIYYFDSLQDSGLRAPVNTQMNKWIINF
jgi:hypothetical protein